MPPRGTASWGKPSTRDGNVEAIRALMVAKRSARSTKVKALNQIRHLGFTAPEEIRRSLQGVSRELIAKQAAALRPSRPRRPGRLRHQDGATQPGPTGPGPRRGEDRPRRAARRTGPRSRPRAAGAARSRSRHRRRPAGHRRRQPRTGCAARRPGPTCAGCRPSRRLRARSPASGSTAAATAKPTRPCGVSSSPACDPNPAPRPTWPAAWRKADPNRKSSGSSNATSPARSTSSFLAPKAARGGRSGPLTG